MQDGTRVELKLARSEDHHNKINNYHSLLWRHLAHFLLLYKSRNLVQALLQADSITTDLSPFSCIRVMIPPFFLMNVIYMDSYKHVLSRKQKNKTQLQNLPP